MKGAWQWRPGKDGGITQITVGGERNPDDCNHTVLEVVRMSPPPELGDDAKVCDFLVCSDCWEIRDFDLGEAA